MRAQKRCTVNFRKASARPTCGDLLGARAALFTPPYLVVKCTPRRLRRATHAKQTMRTRMKRSVI